MPWSTWTTCGHSRTPTPTESRKSLLRNCREATSPCCSKRSQNPDVRVASGRPTRLIRRQRWSSTAGQRRSCPTTSAPAGIAAARGSTPIVGQESRARGATAALVRLLTGEATPRGESGKRVTGRRGLFVMKVLRHNGLGLQLRHLLGGSADNCRERPVRGVCPLNPRRRRELRPLCRSDPQCDSRSTRRRPTKF
jgi:hypothetical protein